MTTSRRGDARRALQRLLKKTFPAEDELRRWLSLGPEEDVIHALPGGNPSLNALVEGLVRILEEQDRLGDEFFRRLREARPQLAAEIAEVRDAWRRLPRPLLRSPPPGATPQWPYAICCLGMAAVFFTGVSFGLAQFLAPEFVLPGAAGFFLLSVAFIFLYERRIKESVALTAVGLYSLSRRTLVVSIAGGGAVGAWVGDDLAREWRERVPIELVVDSTPESGRREEQGGANEATSSDGNDTTEPTTSEDDEAPPGPNDGETECKNGILRDGECHECPRGTALIRGGSYDGHSVLPFCMDLYEVSARDYERCITKGRCAKPKEQSVRTRCTSRPDEEDKGRPINCVTWNDAREFCRWKGKDLPTARQWEWAARGRESARRYPWGDKELPSCDYAVTKVCVESRPKSRSNRRKWGRSVDGVFDLAGNVAEWTSTGVGAEYEVRGGSFTGENNRDLLTSAKQLVPPTTESAEIGVRCVKPLR
ncbi:MAG: SUMF1/EgtB/PvdO family nonheme iron enzyme [Nannocystis sp.]|nr:SUMF1/EgtB/PvdO family nonheme iron enzyme [Nannocystis sp.]